MQKASFLFLLALPFCAACEPECEADAGALVQSAVVVQKLQSQPEHAKVHVAKNYMGEEQQRLHAELKDARKARQQAQAALKELDDRLDDLHTKLSASQAKEDGSPDDAIHQQNILHERKMMQLIMICVLSVLTILYMWRTISQYQANCDKDVAIPWYHDSLCMEKVLGAGALLWLLFGVAIFTQVMIFTSEHRHLSIIESIYLTVQIVTTVGYGDLTPTTNIGKVLMVFYALTGVSVIGALVQQYLLSGPNGEEHQVHSPHGSVGHQDTGHNKHKKMWKNIAPVIVCVIFGTLFYALYPGEGKSYFEAFYMSIITLLTIGFGAYSPTTEVGKLVGSIWMLIGVVFVGEAIVDITQRMFEKRKNLHTKAASMKLFAELDASNTGSIGRMEFLQFELTRHGVPKDATARANKKFDEIDADGSGTLDYEEFEKYVITLEG